jgi:hypothetical protein
LRKTYFILLAVVTVLVLVFALPSAALLASLFTLGLGVVILLPLPYIGVGMWAVLPAVLLWRTPFRLTALAAGVGAVVVALAAPGPFADQALARDLAARGDMKVSRLDLPEQPGIEIRRRVSRDPDLYSHGEGRAGALIGESPCTEACERLLMGGGVGWVRIVLTDDAFGNDRTETHALFVPGDDAACRAANPDLAGGPCVLYAPDHDRPADLTLILDEDRTHWRADHFTPYQPMGFRSAAAHLGAGADAPPVWQATQLFHERPNGRFGYDFGSLANGDGGGGFMLGRARTATPPIDLAGALQTMGLPLAAARVPLAKAPGTEGNRFISPPPDAFDAARVASLIATGPEGGPMFSNAFRQEVNGWHMRLRWTPDPTEAERAIFCATLESPAIRDLFWQDGLIAKHGIECP